MIKRNFVTFLSKFLRRTDNTCVSAVNQCRQVVRIIHIMCTHCNGYRDMPLNKIEILVNSGNNQDRAKEQQGITSSPSSRWQWLLCSGIQLRHQQLLFPISEGPMPTNLFHVRDCLIIS